MARVTLAYPYPRQGEDAHLADESIELPDDEAAALVRDGLARWADDEPTGPPARPEPEEG